jgi:hypothetical protein
MGLGKGAGSGGNKACGKPRQWDPAVAELFLELMREGLAMDKITQNLALPSTNTIWEWTHGRLGAPPEFKKCYEDARRAQADAFANQTISLAGNLDDHELRACEAALEALPDNATEAEKRKAVFHAKRRSAECVKLMVSTRQWVASRMNRHNWGDKVAIEHSTDPDNPPKFNFHDMTDEQLEKIAKLEEELGDARSS